MSESVPTSERERQPSLLTGKVENIRIIDGGISYAQFYIWKKPTEGEAGGYIFCSVSRIAAWLLQDEHHKQWDMEKKRADEAKAPRMPQPRHRVDLEAHDVAAIARLFEEGSIAIPESMSEASEALPEFLASVIEGLQEKVKNEK
jgi:hypothetical protein